MAIKVTGLFQNPQTNLIYESPRLQLVPVLNYPGVLNVEASIISENTSGGRIIYYNIDKASLSYSGSSPYDSLIYGLEGYVIDNLSGSNDINKNAIFERYNP